MKERLIIMLKKFLQAVNGYTKNATISNIASVFGALDKLESAAQIYDASTAHGFLCMISELSAEGKFYGTESLRKFMSSTPACDCPAYFNTDAPLLLYMHYVLDVKAAALSEVKNILSIEDYEPRKTIAIDDFGTFLIKLKKGTLTEWYNNTGASFYVDIDTFLKYVGNYHLMYNLPISNFALYLQLLQLSEYFSIIRQIDGYGAKCFEIYKTKLKEIESKLIAIDTDLIVTLRFISVFDLNNNTPTI